MPKSKSRNKSPRRAQVIMAGPSKKFVELYFTKSALAFKKKFSRRKKLTEKETAQSAPKNRYITTDAIPWRKPEGKKRPRVVMHRRR